MKTTETSVEVGKIIIILYKKDKIVVTLGKKIEKLHDQDSFYERGNIMARITKKNLDVSDSKIVFALEESCKSTDNKKKMPSRVVHEDKENIGQNII